MSGSRRIQDLSIHSAADKDFFRFDMIGPGTNAHDISIRFAADKGDLGLELYDAGFNLVKTATANALGKSISLADIQEGTYFAKVFGVGVAKNRYDLEIDAPSTPTNSLDAWTLLVYMTASTLYGPAERDINELEALVATLPGTVNIAVLLDQSSDPSTQQFATGGGTQAPWTETGRAFLQGDRDRTVVGTTFDIMAEQNTGDPTNLVNFVQWATTERPAEKYGLIFWAMASESPARTSTTSIARIRQIGSR